MQCCVNFPAWFSTLPPSTSLPPPIKVREVTPFLFAAFPPLKLYEKQKRNTINIDIIIISWQPLSNYNFTTCFAKSCLDLLLIFYTLLSHFSRFQPQNYLFPYTAAVIISLLVQNSLHPITPSGALPLSSVSVLSACCKSGRLQTPGLQTQAGTASARPGPRRG